MPRTVAPHKAEDVPAFPGLLVSKETASSHIAVLTTDGNVRWRYAKGLLVMKGSDALHGQVKAPNAEYGVRAMQVQIQVLTHRRLTRPISAILEPNGDGYIAQAVDLPLYGSGDGRKEAIEALKEDIESLYEELMADDDFSEEWLRYKAFLREIVIH